MVPEIKGSGRRLSALLLTLMIGVSDVFAQAPPAVPDVTKPPWGQLLKQFLKDPLLKKPFAYMEASDVKGQAAMLRAMELDVPNRIRAIKYLAEQDCTVFPDARKLLLEQLDPKNEPFEEVRLAAATGLRDMLARHSVNPEIRRKSGGKPDLKTAVCRHCCDTDTLNALARTAYEMAPDGCCYEPSLRVRKMAVEAIQSCGVRCSYRPYVKPVGEIPEQQPGEKPLSPVPSEELPAPNITEDAPVSTSAAPIENLDKVCIVALVEGAAKAASEEFRAEYEGRVYYFSSAEARDRFNSNPLDYAVAYGGCDPVHFLKTNKAVVGRYMARHAGQNYLFVSRETWEQFKANPRSFATEEANSSLASSK